METQETLNAIQNLVNPYGLKAEIMKGIKRVGVQGDNRTYTQVICLSGPFPGYDVLGKLSTEISNTYGFNSVTYEIAKREE